MDLNSVPKRTGFYPVKSLEGKHNYHRLLRIERDGSVMECVFLRVANPRLREEIICRHFIQFLGRNILIADLGVNILACDDPWDFHLALSNSDRFHIEITSIAENKEQYKINNHEENLLRIAGEPTLPLSLIRKLNRRFPNENAQASIDAAVGQGLHSNSELPNPWQSDGPLFFESVQPPPDTCLFEQIKSAIDSKSAKRHDHKEQTVLIIDNRTTVFDVADYHDARKRFEELRSGSPFKEVWLYTGYYSDNDGSNAEYAFAPILVPDETLQRLKLTLERMDARPDKHGLVYT